MSFIARLTTTARTAAPSARLTTNTITPSLAVSGQRLVSSTTPRDSGPVDATKETLKKADRKVSDAAVKGIETGEAAAKKVKDSVGSGSAKGEAERKAGELKGEAAELAGKGKGKAEEVAGEAKGKVKEAAKEFKS
ncbi:hypothetical protein ASPVEDRAFT_81788 [Aspergillus versicolor CBS 583.65]|uniref:LEA domain protein n=1 Tax=Aspergillus versicolor CBS 583.65 TaxID=1036611 RepID=A0A1L9PFC9_ASPVE|nr:uncharacterized protein ASPVEDRAFT_81788 [Aspergillus versicolor CBS 583.65]OJJ00210.1 hypothetical protein ASPVEDRAFT_81788 [Aspergillus versicolor CBS 583.65]